MSRRGALALLLVGLATSTVAAGPKDKKPPEKAPKVEPKPVEPAAADNRRVIGILDVRVEGVPSEIATQFQNGLEAQLDSKRYWLSGRAKMKERMTTSTKWTDGCLVGKCLFDVKTQTAAELVLLAALSGSGTSFGYVVTLVRTDSGEVVAQQGDRCDVCTLNEVMTNATLATIQLINAIPDTLPNDVADRHAAVSLAVNAALTPMKTALETSQRTHKKLGIAFTVGGAILAGAGIALYLTQDKAGYAVATASAGAALAVGGVTVLAF